MLLYLHDYDQWLHLQFKVYSCVLPGDADEAQILVAGQRYLDRPTVLENILNDLFHVFR